jgi:hypothetical protein
LVAAALTAPRLAPALPATTMLILSDNNREVLLIVDRTGTARLQRRCTPWDIAVAWLAGLRR